MTFNLLFPVDLLTYFLQGLQRTCDGHHKGRLSFFVGKGYDLHSGLSRALGVCWGW
jgi:hypothetical protein